MLQSTDIGEKVFKKLHQTNKRPYQALKTSSTVPFMRHSRNYTGIGTVILAALGYIIYLIATGC